MDDTERKVERNLSEKTNAALHEDLKQEEIIRQQPFPEASKLQQPRKKPGLLQLKILFYNRPGDPAVLDRRRQVLGQALQFPAGLLQHHQSLRPVSPTGIVRISALVAVIPASAASGGVSAAESPVAAAGGEEHAVELAAAVGERGRGHAEAEVQERGRGERRNWTVGIEFGESGGGGRRRRSKAEGDCHFSLWLEIES